MHFPYHLFIKYISDIEVFYAHYHKKYFRSPSKANYIFIYIFFNSNIKINKYIRIISSVKNPTCLFYLLLFCRSLVVGQHLKTCLKFIIDRLFFFTFFSYIFIKLHFFLPLISDSFLFKLHCPTKKDLDR